MDDVFDEFKSDGEGVDSSENEVSIQDRNEHIAQVVAGNLVATKIFDAVEVQAGTAAVHIMGRVKKQDEKLFVNEVVFPLLKEMEERGVGGYAGMQYFLKGGSLRYGWVISFQSASVEVFQRDAYALCDSFAAAVPHVEVSESPLMGRATMQSGGSKSGKRGAAPTGG